MLPDDRVKVVGAKTVLTLQADEYFELQRCYQNLTTEGWKAEELPRFQRGQKVWQVSLSRPQSPAVVS